MVSALTVPLPRLVTLGFCACVQVYEQYTAAKLEIDVAVIMPSEQKASLRGALDALGGLKRVSACLSKIDVEKAKATVVDDEIKVKQTIESTTPHGRGP